MELSKPFDYVPQDLLIAKLAAYDVSEEALIYLSHPSNREQCFRINYIYTEFKNIIKDACHDLSIFFTWGHYIEV